MVSKNRTEDTYRIMDDERECPEVDRLAVRRMLEECIPVASEHFSAIGFSSDRSPSYLMSLGFMDWPSDGDVIESDRGKVMCRVRYMLKIPGGISPEVYAVREGLKLFKSHTREYFDDGPKGVSGFASIVVLVDPPDESRGTCKAYSLMARRGNRSYACTSGDCFLDVLVVAPGPSRDGNGRKLTRMFDLVFGKDRDIGEAIDDLGEEFGVVPNQKTAMKLDSMHAYMKGYQDGRGRKDPGFDFGGILDKACWTTERNLPIDGGDGESSRRRLQSLAGALSQAYRL